MIAGRDVHLSLQHVEYRAAVHGSGQLVGHGELRHALMVSMLDGISAQELEHMGADGDQIAVSEDGATLQSPPVQKCTVSAPQIHQTKVVAFRLDTEMLARDGQVIQRVVALRITPHHDGLLP